MVKCPLAQFSVNLASSVDKWGKINKECSYHTMKLFVTYWFPSKEGFEYVGYCIDCIKLS